MPAVTVSSRLSDAIYLTAIVGLSILLAKPVYLVYSGSQERAAQEISSGFARMLDSMSPGTTLVTRVQAHPPVSFSVTLDGKTVAASVGRTTATADDRWHLPHVTMNPGETYVLTLVGTDILVRQAANG